MPHVNLRSTFVLAIVALAAMVTYVGVPRIGATDSVESDYPLRTLPQERFSERGLIVSAWTGSTDGLMTASEIERTASSFGTVGELELVVLEEGEPGEVGSVFLHGEMAEGPLWAVVLSDKPDMPDASPNATTFANVRFLSPRTGELVYGFESAIVP